LVCSSGKEEEREKIIMDIENECALHAVIVPFPLQSHMNALMNLAQLLAMRGFSITFGSMNAWSKLLQ